MSLVYITCVFTLAPHCEWVTWTRGRKAVWGEHRSGHRETSRLSGAQAMERQAVPTSCFKVSARRAGHWDLPALAHLPVTGGHLRTYPAGSRRRPTQSESWRFGV